MRFLSTHRRPAESLAETLIAVTVIGLCTVTALSILRSSIDQSAALSRRIIAENLAQEGMEALFNVRDSNYLRHAGDPTECWYAYGTVVGQSCDLKLTAGSTYALMRQFDDSTAPIFSWDLKEVTDMEDSDLLLDLYEVTIPNYAGGTIQLYAQSGMADAPAGPIALDLLEAHPFQRVVTIDSIDANSYSATVSVFYTVNGILRHVYTHDTIQNTF